ncbi:prepilin peptidase [Vibrio sp. 10N]|uniref:prepilin peptidase n=1 Tax=Vibrio sp. 10N TaxID=3058938 RepID=UPI002812952F|nr:A24 family peptidase [Vibrio sp. 10N]
MDVLIYYPWLFVVFAAILGLIVGSFLNVVIHRLPIMMERSWREECAEAFPEYKITPPEGRFDLSMPSSRCPSCHTPIRIIDNIPLLSWLILRGRCRQCDSKVSIRYPLVELLTALLSATVAWQLGFSFYSVAVIALTFALIAATFIDLDTMLLPDQITLPLLWAGIALALVGISPITLQESVIGAMVGYLCLWSVYWLFKLLTGKEGMGYGDFKLLAALGAWLGWTQLPLIVLLSSVVGVVFGLIQLRMQKKGLDVAFPFGPYLAIAGWVSVLWGDKITHLYLTTVMGVY